MNKELIEEYRNIVKPFISEKLFKINFEGLGKQDKITFEKDFDEILNLAIEALEHDYILERRLKHLLQSDFIRSFDEVDVHTKEYKRDIKEADKEKTTNISLIAGQNGIYTGCINCYAHIEPNPHFKFCPECGRKIV